MQSEVAPPLTRFDIVMMFLRTQFWISVVSTVVSMINAVAYGLVGFGLSFFSFQIVGLALVPLLFLLVFPALLASNALGQTAREPVTSLADVRPLVGRCAGLLLFVQSLGQVLFFSLALAYTLVTESRGSILASLFGSAGAGRYAWLGIGQSLGPLLSFVVGFFLAFGPTIRDNFRAR